MSARDRLREWQGSIQREMKRLIEHKRDEDIEKWWCLDEASEGLAYCAEAGADPEVVLRVFSAGMRLHEFHAREFDSDYARGQSALANAAKGGRTRRSLTPEQVVTARSVFDSYSAARVSKTEQGNRAVAELKRTHNIDISQKTLSRYLAQ